MTALHLVSGTLAFFIDETGAETLNDKNYSVFGFGGCAVLAEHLDDHVRSPWRALRKEIAGSPDAQLHATEFHRTASEAQMEAVGSFFRSYPFARLGVSCSAKTHAPDFELPTRYVLSCLKLRVVDILKWSTAKHVAMIFEETQRLGSEIDRCFGDLRIQENGHSVPVEFYFLPKASAEPALEVADFIAHAIGGHARRQYGGKGRFGLDFKAVFQEVDRCLASYMHIDQVDASGGGGVRSG